MAITINLIKCPSCGADLKAEEGREKMFFSYCGAQIILTNENEHIYRHIDEAGIKKAETDRLVELKKLELIEKNRAQQEKRKNIKIKISIILGAAAVLFMILGYACDMTGLLMPGLFCLIILMYIWIIGMNSKEDEEIDIGDKIRIPSDVDEFTNKNYQSIEAKFRSAGFSNIQSIPLNDLTTGFLKKPNMVESITINGKSVDEYNSRAKLSPDASIVISYHSFR